MKNKETVDRLYLLASSLMGVPEYKDMMKSLHNSVINNRSLPLSEVPLPNYLWITKPGCGVTTLLQIFANYLDAAEAIDFRGKEKFFEFKMEHVESEENFFELARLDTAISDFAGHYNNYSGVIGIDITAWINHNIEEYFLEFLDYIANNHKKSMVVFYAYTDSEKEINKLKLAISTIMRIETITIDYPNTNELVEYVIAKCAKKGFRLSDCAVSLLGESISEIASGEQYNGFKSINKLSEDIIYHLYKANLSVAEEVTAKTLSVFDKNSEYIAQAKVRFRFSKMGFSLGEEMRGNE